MSKRTLFDMIVQRPLSSYNVFKVVTMSLMHMFWLLEYNTSSSLASDLFSCNAAQPYCKHTHLIVYKKHFIKPHNVCRQAHQSL